MFEDLKHGFGVFLGQLHGALPGVQRDYGPAREPFQEGQNADGEQPTVRLVNDYKRGPEPFLETAHGQWGVTPGMKEMLEKYPDAMFPADVTNELFKDAPQQRLKELDIGEDKLRYYAFHAVRIVEQ